MYRLCIYSYGRAYGRLYGTRLDYEGKKWGIPLTVWHTVQSGLNVVFWGGSAWYWHTVGDLLSKYP